MATQLLKRTNVDGPNTATDIERFAMRQIRSMRHEFEDDETAPTNVAIGAFLDCIRDYAEVIETAHSYPFISSRGSGDIYSEWKDNVGSKEVVLFVAHNGELRLHTLTLESGKIERQQVISNASTHEFASAMHWLFN